MITGSMFFLLVMTSILTALFLVKLIRKNRRSGKAIQVMYIIILTIILNDLGSLMLHRSFINPEGYVANFESTSIWNYIKYVYYLAFPYLVTIFLFVYMGSEFFQNYKAVFVLFTGFEIFTLGAFVYYNNLTYNTQYMGYNVNILTTMISTYHMATMALWSVILYVLLKKRRIHTTPKEEILQFIYGCIGYSIAIFYSIVVNTFYDKIELMATTDIVGIIPATLFTFSVLSHKEISIKPRLEKILAGEMTTRLDPGKMYMILGDEVSGREIFTDLATHGYAGLAITRKDVKEFRNDMSMSRTPVLRLSSEGSINTLSPTELSLIFKVVSEYVLTSRKCVVLMEDISYIFANNDMEDVINGLQNISQILSSYESYLIIEKDLQTKDEKLSLLKAGVKIVTA